MTDDRDGVPGTATAGFGGRLVETVKSPLVWIGAVAVAAVGWFQGAGAEWVVALGGAKGLYPHARSTFPADVVEGDPVVIVTWVGLAVVASLAGILLAAGSLGGARAGGKILQIGWWRAIRTRTTLVLPVGLGLGAGVYALAALRPKIGAAADVVFAALLAIAHGWTALTDRYALVKFDTKQDKRSWDEMRAHIGAPNYVNSAAPRGTEIADGTDEAVTDGGKAVFTAAGMRTVLVTFALALPAAVAPEIPRALLTVAAAMIGAQLWTDRFAAYSKPKKKRNPR